MMFGLMLGILIGCGEEKRNTENNDDSNDVNDSDTSSTVDDSDTASNNDTGSEIPEPELTGEELYNLQCASCHGTDGNGDSTNPGIRNELHHTDAQLINTILFGKGDMPRIEISEEHAQSIVDYMREAFGN